MRHRKKRVPLQWCNQFLAEFGGKCLKAMLRVWNTGLSPQAFCADKPTAFRTAVEGWVWPIW